MKSIIYAALAFMSLGTFAATPDAYNCNLTIIAEDVPDGAQVQSFRAIGPETSTHGGQEYTFTFGRHEVVTIANARWRGITWYRDGKIIAAALTVSDEDLLGSKVQMVMNPEKSDSEMIFLECSPAAD